MLLSSGKSNKLLVLFITVSCVYMDQASAAKRLFRNRLSGENIKKPFVLLYEHESFRGKEYVQYISKECVNLPDEYANWASSVDTHRTCASVCTNENCVGPCHQVYSNQGVSKLRLIGFNDKIKSATGHSTVMSNSYCWYNKYIAPSPVVNVALDDVAPVNESSN